MHEVDEIMCAAFGFEVPKKTATTSATVPTKPLSRPLSSMTASDREWLKVWAKKGRPNPANILTLSKALEVLPGFGLVHGRFAVPLQAPLTESEFRQKVLRTLKGQPRGKISYLPDTEGRLTLDSWFGRDPEEVKQQRRVRDWYASRVEIVDGPPKSSEDGKVYGSPIQAVEEGSYGVSRVTFKVRMWIGAVGSMLTTPLGTFFIPAPVAGRGKNRKPEPWARVTNKGYLKRLYMALYEAKLYHIAKAALEGKPATFDPKTREVRQVFQQRSPIVEKVLRELTDRTYHSVIAMNEEGYRRGLAAWQAAADERGGKLPVDTYYRAVLKYQKVPGGSLLFRLVESSGPYGDKTYKARPDAEKVIHERAVAEADEVRNQFLYKNGLKLGAIVNAKDKAGVKLTGAKIVKTGRGTYEGDILFTFADGSSFVVRNQTVGKQNAQGTFFYQFPTTFHDVVLPDGKPMSEPSEERMQKVFAKAK